MRYHVTVGGREWVVEVEGGRVVVPRGSRRGQELVLVVRTPDGPAERTSIPCRFVPLLGDEGFGED